MKIPCPACAAKYSVADDKIQSRLAKIRCRKCGVTIVIDGTVSPVNVYVGEGGQKTGPANSLPAISTPDDASRSSIEAPAENGAGSAASTAEATGPGPNEYAVDIADNDQRNMTLDGVVAAYNAGLVTAETYVWKDGMADWQMLAEVPEIYNALHAAARSAPLRSQSGGAANAGFGRSGSTDLFGGIDVAGSGADLGSTSEPPVVAGTGARNESSVLFSLSALTGTSVPGPSASNGGKSGKRTEDSGLIDLQALTAASDGGGAAYAAASPQATFGGPALISAPLGGVSSSTMNGAFAGYATKRSSNKTGFIIGGSILVAAFIGAGVFIMKSAEPVTTVEVGDEKSAADGKRTAKAAAQPEPEETSAANEPEATAEPEPEATARAEATAEKPEPAPARAVAEAAPVRKPAAAPPPRRNTPASLPSKPAARAPAEEPAPKPAAPEPKPAAEPAKPPAKKACDCKPADLMCAMRCSASKK